MWVFGVWLEKLRLKVGLVYSPFDNGSDIHKQYLESIGYEL